jgi:hypothetical protein
VARDAAHAGERMTLRFWSLVQKELRQIRRDHRLVLSLIIPPVIQLLVFGLALAPEVKNLRVGLVDESLAHFATLARSVLVRGSGLDVVHAQLLALGFFATLLVEFNAWKFRAQMS